MSELINKLALQAFEPINAISSEGVADWHTFNQTWFQLYNKRFAELIIRDCLYQVRKDIGPDDDYHSDWNMGMEHGAEAIEEHFGVE